jgi:glycosyltransferase involved in cell wall biosynthesis
VTVRARLIVPCYNEEKRLDRQQFSELAEKIDLLFVDDGSKDATADLLRNLAASSGGRISMYAMPANAGKGEAVRAGMQRAMDEGAEIVGFTDADLSTPPRELVRLLGYLDDTHVQAVIGARVRLVGRRIERQPVRHMLGRVFASIAGVILQEPFYDTQCGAKFFRVSPLVRKAVEMPFRSRWAFDVELLARLLVGVGDERGMAAGELLEVPLEAWIDIGGSKVGVGAMGKTLVDLAEIYAEVSRMRRRRS